MTSITKREAKTALGIQSDAELGRLFGIGRWAVGQWPDDEPIPSHRQNQLRVSFPEKFGAPIGVKPVESISLHQ